MYHGVFILLISAAAAFAGTVTASADSLWVCNNMASSKADALSISNRGSDTVFIDSAVMRFSVFDTTGFSMMMSMRNIETEWTEKRSDGTSPQTYRKMVPQGENEFVLSGISNADPPMGLIPPFDSITLGWMYIGTCFVCSSLPRYPQYFEGELALRFSNGDSLDIQLYTDDLRPPVKTIRHNPVPVHQPFITTATGKPLYRIDGKLVRRTGSTQLIINGTNFRRRIDVH